MPRRTTPPAKWAKARPSPIPATRSAAPTRACMPSPSTAAARRWRTRPARSRRRLRLRRRRRLRLRLRLRRRRRQWSCRRLLVEAAVGLEHGEGLAVAVEDHGDRLLERLAADELELP